MLSNMKYYKFILNKKYQFKPDHLLVYEFLTYFIYRFANIFFAPFFFHFGHHWLFIEIMVLLTNLVDTVGLFFIMFFFLIVGLIVRNSTFQTFTKNFYKNYLSFSNLLPLTNYISFFFNIFLRSISFLVNKIFWFFKKK